ncbi:MAG: DUF4124 domain-containing protein [Moraxellaceae bacterium]|nr:DUF4124 domain-containing protein [Moraxellaceae bacterium]MBH2030720.1 DUF4124 domain-containing protein [Moraxellaceae bacterium]
MKPSYLKASLYTIATVALLFCSSQNYAQQYYKWMDANGSTHYTTTPPPKGAKNLNKISTYGSSHQNIATPTAAPQVQNEIQQPAVQQLLNTNPAPVNATPQAPAAAPPIQTPVAAPVRVKPNL